MATKKWYSAAEVLSILHDRDSDQEDFDPDIEIESSDDGDLVDASDIRTLLTRLQPQQTLHDDSQSSSTETVIESRPQAAVVASTSTAVDHSVPAADSVSNGTHRGVGAGSNSGTTVRRVAVAGRARARGRGRGRASGRDTVTVRHVRHEEDWADGSEFEPTQVDFTEHVGVSAEVNTENFTAYDFVNLFITNEILGLLVQETNRYAAQYMADNEEYLAAKPKARAKNWKDTNIQEMRVFLGLLFLMGLDQRPELHMYWSTCSLFHTPIFSKTMPRDRFLLLLKYIHFNDNSKMPAAGDALYDRLYKIRPLLDKLQVQFEKIRKPQRQISVDESLLLWKGRLGFKQYMPLKRARFGIKMFLMCDRTGYTYRFRVYQGKEDPITSVNNDLPADTQTLTMTEKVVVWLMGDLLDKGYIVYADNFYSSVNLNRYLLAHNTLHCGTVRKNRVPQCVQNLEVPARNFSSLCKDGTHIFKFMDSKEVFIVSSLHNDNFRRRRRGRTQAEFRQPMSSVDYNYYMGGVDIQDQLIEPYDITRKCQKWTKKLGFHFLQVATLNAHIVAKERGYKKDYLDFLREFVAASIQRPVDPTTPAAPTPPGNLDDAQRVGAAHFPRPIPPTETKDKPYRKCRVCTARGVRSDCRYMCTVCPSKPALCIDNGCFELYHTVVDYTA